MPVSVPRLPPWDLDCGVVTRIVPTIRNLCDSRHGTREGVPIAALSSIAQQAIEQNVPAEHYGASILVLCRIIDVVLELYPGNHRLMEARPVLGHYLSVTARRGDEDVARQLFEQWR